MSTIDLIGLGLVLLVLFLAASAGVGYQLERKRRAIDAEATRRRLQEIRIVRGDQ